MCGICGIYEFSGSNGGVDTQLLVRMRDVLKHRGPDGAGEFVSQDRRVGLAQRRLAIVDVEGGAQPMFGANGEALVFNGEIYNYPQLRRQLEARGVRFYTRCDTEVILRLYECYGEQCVDFLEGMFAFAIWDPIRSHLVFARDPIGEKPLYWTEVSGSFIFASEIKAMLLHPSLRPRLNEKALAGYLANLVTTTPQTLFDGIYKLAPGQIGTCDSGGVSIRRYWDVFLPRRWHEEAVDPAMKVRTLLEQSVDARLMSDVPVGVLLSGGIDSTTILALMKDRTKGLATFSVGYEGVSALDERDVARRVAQHYGTDHHEVAVSEQDAVRFLERLVHHQDEPLADPVCLPLYFVCRLASENGIKVVLAGEGADELFWGYPRYLRILARWPLMRAALALPRPGRRLLPYAFPARTSPRRHEHLDAIASGRPLPAHFPLGLGSFDRTRFLRPDLLEYPSDGWRKTGHQPGETRLDCFAFDTQEYEFALRLPELLLMRIDRFSMANSIEARVPFLAPDLVNYVYRLPLRDKLAGGQTKITLRAAIADIVPTWVLERPKQGFGAPVGVWMATRFGEILQSMLDDDTIRAYFRVDRLREMLARTDGHRRLSDMWPILNFGLWHRYWIENKPAIVA